MTTRSGLRFTTFFTLILACLMVVITGCHQASGPAARTATPPASGSDLAIDMRQSFASSSPVPGRMASTVEALTAVMPGDELWVIVPPGTTVVPDIDDDDETPGSGGLVTTIPMRHDNGATEETVVPLPLEHTDVTGAIAGIVSSVTVKQAFHNPFDSKIEAQYVFPLPQSAAVSDFVMVIGERRIRGIIRERQEAERIYESARSQGHVASLMTQERPNIFTQKVANIEPGKRIDIEIKYFNTMAYVDGWYEFVFPMVVGPRFNPPHTTDGVGAIARGSRSRTQRTSIPYMRPNERSGHDIDLAVTIDAGVPIQEIQCASHVVETSGEGSAHRTVRLGRHDRIPNKDFVLRYRVAGDRIDGSMLTAQDERGEYFALMVYPPSDLESIPRAPIEMIFVVDCSGSMNGAPMRKAKRAIERTLRQLGTDDTFQIIRFSDQASTFGQRPVVADRDNVAAGLRYIQKLKAGGGTMMTNGIKQAFDFPHDDERLRFITFMTDGYIGNEAEILNIVGNRIGDSRIFSFGVGSSPNRYLMEQMARLGRGAVAYLGLNDDPAIVMDQFIERVRHPALTDVRLEWPGGGMIDTVPTRIPDLFVGRPVILAGRFDGEAPTSVRITGRAGGQRLSIPIDVRPAAAGEARDALPNVWARLTIADIANHAIVNGVDDASRRIRELALEYRLMSAYTAFVAVDSSRRTDGQRGTVVPVAVPVPDGVRYDTTVGGE